MANRDELVRELKSLRKGRGLSVTKMRTCPNLMDVFKTDAPANAHESLLSALAQLGDGVEERALRNALGAIGKSTDTTLTERRIEFSVQAERSVDTVQEYEDRAINELVERLDLSPEPDEHPDLEELDSQLKLASNAMEAIKLYGGMSELSQKERAQIMTSPTPTEDQSIDWARDNLKKELDGFSFSIWNSKKAFLELVDLVASSMESSWIISGREAYMRGRSDVAARTSKELTNLFNYLAADD